MPNTPAQRRYNQSVLLASAGYGVSLIGGTMYFRDHPGSQDAAAYLCALVPAFCIVVIFVALGRYLMSERDEYLRMLMVRQALVASAVALTLATIWGFLESFGLAPHIDAYWVAVAWFGGLGLGSCVNKLIDRRAA